MSSSNRISQLIGELVEHAVMVRENRLPKEAIKIITQAKAVLEEELSRTQAIEGETPKTFDLVDRKRKREQDEDKAAAQKSSVLESETRKVAPKPPVMAKKDKKRVQEPDINKKPQYF